MGRDGGTAGRRSPPIHAFDRGHAFRGPIYGLEPDAGSDHYWPRGITASQRVIATSLTAIAGYSRGVAIRSKQD
jgi:hypothetical protein